MKSRWCLIIFIIAIVITAFTVIALQFFETPLFSPIFSSEQSTTLDSSTDSTATPKIQYQLNPRFDITSEMPISNSQKDQLISIINIPSFIKSARATITQFGKTYTLFNLPEIDDYFISDNKLNMFLPRTLLPGISTLTFEIEESDGTTHTGATTTTLYTPAESKQTKTTEETCDCTKIELITAFGGDGQPTTQDRLDFNLPQDALVPTYIPKEQSEIGSDGLRYGFMIKAICKATSEVALKKCIEGQELKSTLGIKKLNGEEKFYCKRESFNPKSPLVPLTNPSARCYDDPSVDTNANPDDDTKVVKCLTGGTTGAGGGVATSTGFGDDDYHSPHDGSGSRPAKIHKLIAPGTYEVKWVDVPRILQDSKGSLASVTSSSYFHAYVIGRSCPKTGLCNKCFTIETSVDFIDDSGRRAGQNLQDATQANYAIIKKVDCKFI